MKLQSEIPKRKRNQDYRQKKRRKITPCIYKGLPFVPLRSYEVQESTECTTPLKYFPVRDPTSTIIIYKFEHFFFTRTNITFKVPSESLRVEMHPNGSKIAYWDNHLIISDACKNYEKKSLGFENPLLDFKWSSKGRYFWVSYNASTFLFEDEKCICEYFHDEESSAAKIEAVHPSIEERVLITFEDIPCILQFNRTTKKIECLKKLEKVSFNFALDPFDDTWSNYAYTTEEDLVIKRGSTLYALDEDFFIFEVLKEDQCTGISNLVYLDSCKLFFSIEKDMFIAEEENANQEFWYYSCIIDFSGTKPLITRWKTVFQEDGSRKGCVYDFEVLSFPKKEIKEECVNEVQRFEGDVNDIVDDCWKIIFSFLDLNDFINVSLTCKWWNALTDEMWRLMSFQKWKLHPKNIENWKKYYLKRTKLESLTWIVENKSENGLPEVYYPERNEDELLEFLKL